MALFGGRNKNPTRRGKRRRWLLFGIGAGALVQYLRDRGAGGPSEATTSEPVPDHDRALVDKVRSEALGGAHWRPYTINVDAVDGVVTLRGQLDRQDQINAAEGAVRDVPGVEHVRSFLHLPGEQPHNVETARQASR